MVGAGILTVDEAREDLGRGPLEEKPEDEGLELVKGLRMIKSQMVA